jgi:hypothetical protein
MAKQGSKKPREKERFNWSDIFRQAAVPVLAAVVLAAAAFLWQALSGGVGSLFDRSHAEFVTWLSESDGSAPGIDAWAEDRNHSYFVPWSRLRAELESGLLPKLFRDPTGFHFETKDFHGKKHWIVEIVDANGQAFGYLWLGVNPEKGWEFDGLVRVGGDKAPFVWQTYRRYSDGTYRRLQSRFSALEDACPPAERPCISQ